MSDPSKFGPPGGPLSGSMEAQQDYANKYNKAAQEKQAAISKLAKELAPKEKATPEQQPQKERGGPER